MVSSRCEFREIQFYLRIRLQVIFINNQYTVCIDGIITGFLTLQSSIQLGPIETTLYPIGWKVENSKFLVTRAQAKSDSAALMRLKNRCGIFHGT